LQDEVDKQRQVSRGRSIKPTSLARSKAIVDPRYGQGGANLGAAGYGGPTSTISSDEKSIASDEVERQVELIKSAADELEVLRSEDRTDTTV